MKKIITIMKLLTNQNKLLMNSTGKLYTLTENPNIGFLMEKLISSVKKDMTMANITILNILPTENIMNLMKLKNILTENTFTNLMKLKNILMENIFMNLMKLKSILTGNIFMNLMKLKNILMEKNISMMGKIVFLMNQLKKNNKMES